MNAHGRSRSKSPKSGCPGFPPGFPGPSFLAWACRPSWDVRSSRAMTGRAQRITSPWSAMRFGAGSSEDIHQPSAPVCVFLESLSQSSASCRPSFFGVDRGTVPDLWAPLATTSDETTPPMRQLTGVHPIPPCVILFAGSAKEGPWPGSAR
jgi:hypothetical protein